MEILFLSSRIYSVTAILILASIIIVCFYDFRDNGKKPPHIVFILADDMGWNDVSFHGSPQIPTPNIDALAASGIVLQNYYTAAQCTPSRGSFLTGKYAIYLGLQHYVISAAEPVGLPLGIKTLPEYLKSFGYSNHLVGKWHLGYHRKEYTPTYRGFDSFYGYWNGFIDYYDYTNGETTDIPEIPLMWGVDLHDGLTPIKHIRGKYATELFTEKAVDIILNHDESKPLFLFLSHLATHSGSIFKPLQVPAEYVSKFAYIQDIKRRTYAGVVSALDFSVGQVFSALNEKGILDNTIIVFLSDNGGETDEARGAYASNWPLRGSKFQHWEGGVKVPAVIWSPLFQLQDPRVSTHIMHVTDWLPTFFSAAGGNATDIGDINGLSMWQCLTENTPCPRDEVLLNVDPIWNISAIRKGNYKLLQGNFARARNSWYGYTGVDNLNVLSIDEWVWKEGSVIKKILEDKGKWLIKTPDVWRTNLTTKCDIISQNKVENCDLSASPCLFNLAEDPCEQKNVANKYPKIVQNMIERIKKYNATALPPSEEYIDPHGDPTCHDFVYVPWLDDEHKSDCPYLS